MLLHMFYLMSNSNVSCNFELNRFLWRQTQTLLFIGELKLFYLTSNSHVLCDVKLKLFYLSSNSNRSIWCRTQTVLFHVELQAFYLMSNSKRSFNVELNLFYLTSNSTVLMRQVLLCSLVCQTQLFYSTLQRVYSTPSVSPVICAYLLCKKSCPWPFHFAYTVQFRYYVLCTLSTNVIVSCIKRTLLCWIWTLHYSVTLNYCCAY